MDEAEWRGSTDPEKMLRYLRRKAVATDRKLRLFACACCRMVWHLMPDGPLYEWARTAVEVAERFADGLATEKDLDDIHEHSWSVAAGNRSAADCAAIAAFWSSEFHAATAAMTALTETWNAALHGATVAEWQAGIDAAEGKKRAALLRDVISQPLLRQRNRLSPTWLTSDVTSMAQTAYDERILPAGTLDPDRLAVLADALEEAGCDNADLLSHLRGPGPHVRGCWAVDLLLEKAIAVRVREAETVAKWRSRT